MPGVFGQRARAEAYAALWASHGCKQMTLYDLCLTPPQRSGVWCRRGGEGRLLSVSEVRVTQERRETHSPAPSMLLEGALGSVEL